MESPFCLIRRWNVTPHAFQLQRYFDSVLLFGRQCSFSTLWRLSPLSICSRDSVLPQIDFVLDQRVLFSSRRTTSIDIQIRKQNLAHCTKAVVQLLSKTIINTNITGSSDPPEIQSSSYTVKKTL